MNKASPPTGKPLLSDSQMAQVRKHIKGHENAQKVDHPYFDTKGHLTVGPGFKIENKEEFRELGFTVPDGENGTRPANDAEKDAAYDAMMTRKPKTPEEKNRTAQHYKGMDGLNLTMPDKEMDRQIEARINTRAHKISQEIGAENWDRLSDGAKQTAIDVTYTTSDGNLDGWPELKKGLKNNDIEKIADESLFYTDKGKKTRPKDRIKANLKALLGTEEEAERVYQDKTKHDRQGAAEQPASEQPIVARKEEEKDSPDAARIRSLADRVENDPFDALDDLLLLRPDQITEAQSRAIGMAYADLPSGDPRREEFARQRTAYFDRVYGTDPQRKDFTGRPMDDGPKHAPPENPSRPRDGADNDIGAAVKKTAGVMAHYAKGTGLAPAVAALQSGLNLIERAQLVKDKAAAAQQRKSGAPAKPETPFTFQGLLKEDGDFGPKTHARLKRTAAREGAGAANNALALGGFRTLADAARRGERGARAAGGADGGAGAAKSLVDGHMGAMFPARSQAPKRKPQVRALQSTLNAMRPPGVEELKEDGDFGPKTASVFTATAKKRDPDELTERFGRELGFIN
ncbi:MAG: hypothetical protein ACYYKD_04910 [Rhodospirillales bacterium]